MSLAERKERKRVALLNKIVDLALDYGVAGYIKNHEVWCVWPNVSEKTTLEMKYERARKSATTLSDANYSKLKEVYAYALKNVRALRSRADALDRIEQRIVDESRVKAMLELYQSGNEDHPAYAVLAAAGTFAEIKSITTFRG